MQTMTKVIEWSHSETPLPPNEGKACQNQALIVVVEGGCPCVTVALWQLTVTSEDCNSLFPKTTHDQFKEML